MFVYLWYAFLWVSLMWQHSVTLCPKDTLAIYDIHFETFWDRRDFPKHYPEFRPPASWSKLVGYSHNETFKLYRKRETSSPALKAFAETANSHFLDLQTQGSKGIFDAFVSKPIYRGVGEARVSFTADSNNSKVSMISKIIPSPDWFVGVDSYELCRHDRWMEYIHFTVEPLDAGTDKGLTFTSPNWPSEPQEPIRVITSHLPNHPAGSFYYPELDSLPDLATITISKVNEYSKKEKFDAADHSSLYTDFALQMKEVDETKEKRQKKQRHMLKKHVLDQYKNQVEYVVDENAIPDVEKSKMEKSSPPKETLSENHINHFDQTDITTPTTLPPYKQITEPHRTIISSTTPKDIDKEPPAKVSPTKPSKNVIKRPMRGKPKQRFTPQHRMRVPHRKRIPTGDAMAVIDDILKNYQREHKKKLRKQRRDERRKRRKHIHRIRPPRDCRISEWSEWSTCSKTCGIGEQTRKRKMIKRARRGGKPCPELQETTWCGSARACERNYFNWTF